MNYSLAALPLLIALLVLLPAAAADMDYASQTDRAGGVTIKVTPHLSPLGESWDFEVELTTHTVPLEHDMVSAVILTDGAGTAQPAVTWDGDPPGGHHRKGRLRFRPLAELPEVIERGYGISVALRNERFAGT